MSTERAIRRLVREAIYLDDYAPSHEDLSAFADQVRMLARKARDLGLPKTEGHLMSLVLRGGSNEWWTQLKSVSRGSAPY